MLSEATHEEDSFIYTCLDKDDDSSSNNSSGRDLQHVLRTIEKAAYFAGQIALSTAGKIAVKSTKANARDLVTESDMECQSLIKAMILKEFPDDVFLGEEDIDLSGQDSSSASSEALKEALGITEKAGVDDRLLFVVVSLCLMFFFFSSSVLLARVITCKKYSMYLYTHMHPYPNSDPIDGTTNFQAGLPIYAMSIGVVSLVGSTPEVVAGVIYNPTLGEMTSAVQGRGCYLNNRRINPHSGHDDNMLQQKIPQQSSILSQSLINVGFPVCKESTLLASSRAVTALATKVRGLRMVACASQAMAWVAHSKFSSYFSWDLNAWDVAAGMVIVEESGGLVSNFDGTKADISSRDMIITCCPGSSAEEGLLRDELIQVLRDNDCLQY
eukprot:CAMPEP_0183785332 /NCGR_PEP_ID=MMETSP0739-20130205/66450_1 /TAXON_ID=385413 /ORGANISM="Thalassiosira miniscula, Strain CCMP1093" /LENGTH=383 /DNA_ID=CAMNT_0026029333 /DNA_START=235 /DNA_END=1387 /DNA_ORIENTATION=-